MEQKVKIAAEQFAVTLSFDKISRADKDYSS
jgi:hypothetical protein